MSALHETAEQQNIPLRTLSQVQNALMLCETSEARDVMARLMLRHGRLTDEAREYVAREYPQS